MAELPPQFLVHCHFLRWSKKMFQFPPESDECNYHDKLQLILAQFLGEGASGTNEIGKN